jgi:hypothetical protein
MSGTSDLLFANAMWRSGSTYLASRFAASDRYLLFYEPCHEGISRRPSAARDRDRSRQRPLRHPSLEGGYFANYDLSEPESGLALSSFHAPDISLRNVYNDPSERAVHFLSRLGGAAHAKGQTAFLGFCRSGTQMPEAAQALGANSLHLWRAPREQFASYGWPDNDYFMAGTLMQLAFSRRFKGTAQRLTPRAFVSPFLHLALNLPDRQTRHRYRLARRAAAVLNGRESYALFYLSWLVSDRAGRSGAELSFSLTELAHDAGLKAQVEQRYGISLEDLRPTPAKLIDGIDYDAVEAEVEAAINSLIGAPSSEAQYPPSALIRA